jgi:hypothetical protein
VYRSVSRHLGEVLAFRSSPLWIAPIAIDKKNPPEVLPSDGFPCSLRALGPATTYNRVASFFWSSSSFK